ncbi:MAG: T9SS type A sorting domain-containing protein [Ignavibacteriae bacterium]|nr:T9SS type A sorting domain-containing protein [Ignavibacteriota bacterium]
MKKILIIVFLFLAGEFVYSQPLPPFPVYPSGDTCVNPQNVHFNWHLSTGATIYRIQVWLGTNIILDVSGITDTFYIPVGVIFTANTLYYWRLNATGPGGTSNWTSVFSFSTCPGIPNPPTLLAPPDSSTVPVNGVTFDWTDVPGATNYRIQISTSSNFGVTFVNTVTTSSQYTNNTPIFNYNTLYYWRVNATNAGGTSTWSSVWRIITAPAPPLTPSIYPVNRGKPVYADSATIFEWHYVPTATSYRIQISTSTPFPNPIINEVVYDTLYIAPPYTFMNYTQYYWRVNASNSGGTSPWSTVWNFSVITSPPNPPTLLSPLNNATNVSLTPTLDWNTVLGASSYRVQVSQNQNFNTFKVNVTTTSSQYNVLPGVLEGNTLYYWRAKTYISSDSSIWSDVWNFTTLNQIGINLISSEIPTEYKLFNNYPNPFNPNTIIRFQIKDSRLVTLKIFDVLGKEVEILVNEKQSPGIYEVSFNGSNLSSGIYFYTIRSGDFTDTKRMLMIK